MSPTWWSDDERRALILSVGGGHQERPLTPVMVATLLSRAADQGASTAQMADALHLDASTMIGRFLSLRKLPESVQRTVGWGRQREGLNLTQAQEIARLSSPSDQALLAEAATEHRLSSGELRSVVQLVKNSGDEAARAIEKTLALRPELEKRFVAIGAINSQVTKSALAKLSSAERGLLLRELLPIPVEGASLTPSHFTVSTATQLPDVESLEATVNAALDRRLGSPS